jgi:hypothetical protein
LSRMWRRQRRLRGAIMIVNPRDTLTEVVTQCACGRSPTGKCVGWHNLTEEQFERRLQKYNEDNPKQEQ